MGIILCTMLPYIAPSVLMQDMMADYNIGYTLAGLAMTVVLGIAGICFFVGTFIQDRIGSLNTIKLCMVSQCIGVIICCIAPNIAIFLLGRALCGFGYGLSVGAQSFISSWFQGKELSYVLTVYTVASGAALAFTTGFASRIGTMLGGWQRYYWICAVVFIIFTVLWLVFGKNSPEGEALEKQRAEQAANTGKTQSALALAMKEVEIWKIAIFALLFIAADTARATYMPSYLMTERGIASNIVYAATSMFSIVGMVAGFIGGFFATKIKNRKAVLGVSCLAYMICGLGTAFLPGMAAVFACVALGFFYNMKYSSQNTWVIEICMAKNPTLVSGAFAITSGTALLVTFIVSPIFSALTNRFSMSTAMALFFLSMIIGFIALMTMKHTWKKKEEPGNASE